MENKEKLFLETVVLLSADLYETIYKLLGHYGDTVDKIIELAEKFEDKLNWQKDDTRDYTEELEKFERDFLDSLN